MEDKIEVGEYVRTSKGKLLKVENEKTLQIIKFLSVEYGDIVKHSKNIIDLIEKYEFANERLIIDIDRKNNKICLLEPFDDRNLSDSFIVWYDIKDIKSIVTKEQFNSVKYVIPGEK